MRALATKICEGCEEEFKPKRSTQVFCSQNCSETRNSRRSGPRLWSDARKAVTWTRDCSWCGEEFRTNHGSTKYCGRRCRLDAASARALQGPPRPNSKRAAEKAEWLADRDRKMQEQGNKCAICSMPFDELETRDIHYDHNHVTGEWRGVLCHLCNRGLGHFRDNVEILKTAVIYLEGHND